MPVFLVRLGGAFVRAMALVMVMLIVVSMIPLMTIGWPWLPWTRVRGLIEFLRSWTRDIMTGMADDADIRPEVSWSAEEALPPEVVTEQLGDEQGRRGN